MTLNISGLSINHPSILFVGSFLKCSEQILSCPQTNPTNTPWYYFSVIPYKQNQKPPVSFPLRRNFFSQSFYSSFLPLTSNLNPSHDFTSNPNLIISSIVMKEMLDVLSQDGNPMGIAKDRTLVHKDGDWHRSVHVWIINEKGQLLLQLRAPDKDTFPNRWDVSCAGHISSGFNSFESVKSELVEELGISLVPFQLEQNTTIFSANSSNNDSKEKTKIGDGFLTFLGTRQSSATGFTKKLGNFRCNEFQDVYLLESRGVHTELLTMQQSELANIKFFEPQYVRDMLVSKSEKIVPRKEDYIDLLFGALQKRNLNFLS